jgi:hypothetical protein
VTGRLLLAAVLVAGVLHGAASAGGGAPPADGLRLAPVAASKVGRVEGTRAFVAVAFDGRRVQAYVCDGTARRPATISQWFRAPWHGRRPLTLVHDGVELRLDPVHADGRITGRVLAFSGPHAFTVRPATGPAGLYDGTDASGRVRATWIVLRDGSVRGAMACPRPPRRVCRVLTVTLTNGATREEVRCFEVSGC